MRRPVLFALCLALGGCTKAAPRPGPQPEQALADDELGARAMPSIQLTTSDGHGLKLVELEAKGVVQGPLGFTELHLTFDNPEPRVLEGRFLIDLPPGAALSRFAMKVRGQWQEGEIVERTSARRIYDRHLHGNVDPALLEKQAGNRFSAKVFPIPAGGRKELVLSYSQLLEGEASYRVPLRGLPELEQFDATIFVHEPDGAATRRRVVRRHELDYTPEDDLEIASETMPESVALRADAGVVARVVVDGDAALEPIETLTIAFDTSASRARGFSERVRKLDALVDALARHEPTLDVRVLAFDQTIETIFEGRAAAFGPAQREALLARGGLGASDLGGLLSSLADDAPARLLLLTDGVATVGDMQLTPLRTRLNALGAEGLRRLDVVLDAAEGSDTLLRSLVQGELPDDGALMRTDRDADTLARTIARRMLDPIRVQMDGATTVWPPEIRGAQPGDAVVVFAHGVPRGDATVSLRGGVDQDIDVDTLEVPGPLVTRALATARVDALTAEHAAETDPYEQETLRREIVALSQGHRVISDFTAMLVLESKADYLWFGIRPEASTEILVVGDEGAEQAVHQRTVPPEGATTSRGARDAFPAMTGRPGILGLMQQDAGHFLASPYGAAFAVGNEDDALWSALTEETGRPRPDVRLINVFMPPGLDNSLTRRVIRAHLGELRDCYQQGLLRDPELSGYVDLEFSIRPSGRATLSSLGRETLDDRATDRCLQRATRRWRFPKPPDAMTVGVQARFRFRPGRGRADGPAPSPLPVRRWFPPKPPPAPNVPPENLRDVDAAVSQPHVGRMLEVSEALGRGEFGVGLAKATQWRRQAPEDIVALLALGKAYEAAGRRALAARAYGSLIDLFPSDAPMLRHAADRLAALGGAEARSLAVDAARRALKERPDHPSSHRAYAWTLDAAGRHEQAFEIIRDGARRHYAARYEAARAILHDDAVVIAARWLADSPKGAASIETQLSSLGLRLPTEPVTHFVLSWETDANDVDLHVYDGDGNHAYYRQPTLPTGGHLYADVQDGYGPESFTIRGEPKGFPYRIDVDYFRRGPMGYGLGSLQVISSDPTRPPVTVPFVLMMEKGRARLLEHSR